MAFNNEEEITLQELMDEFGYSESYITKRFKQFQQSLEKKYGAKIRTNGKRGAEKKYLITRTIEDIDQEPPQLPVIGDKRYNDEFAIALTDLGLQDYELMIITFLIWLPMQAFRGTIEMFLTCCKQRITDSSLKGVTAALGDMKNRGWVEIVPLDDDNYFIITLQRKFEKDMTPVAVNINMIAASQDIAKKYNKRKPMQLFRVWLTLNYVNLRYNGIFKNELVEELTGLSRNTILEYKKLLEQENVLTTGRRTMIDENGNKICIGQKVYINELREENRVSEDDAAALLKINN